nr:hypothetical protein B0A51_07654 [Rachicladosporium sp. CCFEE 5018]
MPENGSASVPKVEVEEREVTTNVVEAEVAMRVDAGAGQDNTPVADEFGLPVRPPRRRQYEDADEPPDEADVKDDEAEDDKFVDAVSEPAEVTESKAPTRPATPSLDTVSPPEEPLKPPDEATPVSPASPKSPRTTRKSGDFLPGHTAKPSNHAVSEWSHQALAPREEEEEEEDDQGQWQPMPALATFRQYDDWGKVTAKAYDEVDDETMAYGTLGGAAKGYTRVGVDEDAQSQTSFDDNTAYLFKEGYTRNALDEEDEARDLISQMQTTKELLTEGQRIAYVGVVRLSMSAMMQELEKYERTKGSKKLIDMAMEATKMWAQKMMVRLYSHMEISTQEQVMIEQLAEHGLQAADLTPQLMQNARVKNPGAAPVDEEGEEELEEAMSSSARLSVSSPRPSADRRKSATNQSTPGTPSVPGTPMSEAPPPAYEDRNADDLHIEDPDTFGDDAKNIDLDLRWTVLCDLFLLLIADSTYDSRSRVLLERVGTALAVDWQELCRFEKRVTDALEMQEQADKENWNEEEHMQAREKARRNRRLMVMGLCTVGGGLVIGLSAGLLAPVIGAGLAAGFTSIGVAGTSSFFAGTGAAALIGTTGALTGANIGIKASHRRTGAVKTFEYRPLHNNKRVNLIVTVAGWMTGKVDDVRLPFSTVDPIMGDMYSVHWEPEMLQSTGATIQILGTEALTQTIQQVLGATFLATLMAGISTPILLTKLAYLVDNPWTVSCARADAAGLILADSLIDRNLGVRPITLVGFSLGARVIFSALRELASRGALGLIQNVYIFGSPVVFKKDEWLRARSVVSGRFVNGYAVNDWILGYLFRATGGGIAKVAGLSPVEIAGIENVNVTDKVPGHMAYRAKMPLLLQTVGWEVESLEFTEIEDPDPENHEKRQRELINEIEEARRAMEEEPKKKGFLARFSRKKAPAKKNWETYDETSAAAAAAAKVEAEGADPETVAANNADLMFDVDAIHREVLALATKNPEDLEEIKAHLQVREIESTLPPMRIETPRRSGEENSTFVPLRQVQSFGAEAGPSHSANGSPQRGISPAPPDPAASQAVNGHTHNDHTSSPSLKPSLDLPPSRSATPDRLPLSSRATTPVPSILHTAPPPTTDASSTPAPAVKPLGHNPWADEEEFGKEKEVSMSFE